MGGRKLERCVDRVPVELLLKSERSPGREEGERPFRRYSLCTCRLTEGCNVWVSTLLEDRVPGSQGHTAPLERSDA